MEGEVTTNGSVSLKLTVKNADRILRKRGVGVVGLSPGNTKFTLDCIRDTLRFAADSFSKGIGASKPDKVAKWEGNRIKKVVKQVLQSMETKHSSIVEILEWETLSNSPYFRIVNEELNSLFQTNTELHEDFLKATIPVLKHLALVHKRNPEAVNAEEGALYILEEIAGLSAIPEVVGIEDFCVVYHNSWTVFEKFVEGIYDDRKKALGWFVYDPPIQKELRDN